MTSRPSRVSPPLRTKRTERAKPGTYRTLDLIETFERMPEIAVVLRPILDVGDPDPNNATSQPHLAALGALTVSSSHVLVRRTDQPVWDVNGYYRALGIPWPYRPTKAEMRDAYLHMDGQSSKHATYAFKKLLDPEFRDFYDHRDLGKPVDDIYGWLLINRRGALWAAAKTLQTGELHTAEDFVPEDVREQMHKIAKEEQATRRLDYAPSNNVLWPYGYYLWDTRFRDDMTLSVWQSILVAAFWNRGLSTSFAVGYFERTSNAAAVRYRLSHPDVDALLLRSGTTPTTALADVVVATYQTDPVLPLARPLFVEHTQNPVEPP